MFQIVPATSEEAISKAKNLLREYALIPGVVACLADFENEVASLPGRYAPPSGRLLLATQTSAKHAVAGIDLAENFETVVGCGALRRLDDEVCEMKRLYVRAATRGTGAGRELAHALIAEARTSGYKSIVLDTLPWMQSAHELYRKLGFREISSYQENPIPGALFFELRL